MRVLLTGAAGFIGFHCAQRLLLHETTEMVVGVDNLNAYYDPVLKAARLDKLTAQKKFRFAKADIADAEAMRRLWAEIKPTHVLHLAAQAGVRYAAQAPFAYTHSNINGFLSILEACRAHPPAHLLYASSSAVYGLNEHLPFAEDQMTDRPASLYGATKKANELMAHSYAHLYGLAATGLRFFTVYGPWGRPDMAFFKFTKAMLSNESIPLYNSGQMIRDFTYIDDVVAASLALFDKPPMGTPPHRVLNIGGASPVLLLDAVAALEAAVGVSAARDLLPFQPGDVPATTADPAALKALVGFIPETPLGDGLGRFVEWYRGYYGG
ncbi:MAG: NAD-dependent epimerase/dehydratase family protein [Holosporales bacterium]